MRWEAHEPLLAWRVWTGEPKGQIARSLGVSAPALSIQLGRMREKGYILPEAKNTLIHFTPELDEAIRNAVNDTQSIHALAHSLGYSGDPFVARARELGLDIKTLRGKAGSAKVAKAVEQVLDLRRSCGLSHRRIANGLPISAGAVRKILNRAMVLGRDSLKTRRDGRLKVVLAPASLFLPDSSPDAPLWNAAIRATGFLSDPSLRRDVAQELCCAVLEDEAVIEDFPSLAPRLANQTLIQKYEPSLDAMTLYGRPLQDVMPESAALWYEEPCDA